MSATGLKAGPQDDFEIDDLPWSNHVTISVFLLKSFKVFYQQAPEDKTSIVRNCEIYLAAIDCQQPNDFFAFLETNIPNRELLLVGEEKKSMLVILERIFANPK